MIRILHDTRFDFIKWWRPAAMVTVAFIVLGLASFAFRGGVNYSIEFTGGTLMQLRFAKPVPTAELRSTLDAAGVRGAEIQQFGSPTEFTVRAQEKAQVQAQASAAEGIARQI